MPVPVVIKIAAGLQPWETPPGSLPWLEFLVDLESKTPGYQGQGFSAKSIVDEFNKSMKSKDAAHVNIGYEGGREQLDKTLRPLGFVTKIESPGVAGVRWVSSPAGREALAVLGQRGAMWGALNKLLESGKVSKEDVLKAMTSGYKNGSEAEMLGIVSPPTIPVPGA